jgi:hypothetical protein
VLDCNGILPEGSEAKSGCYCQIRSAVSGYLKSPSDPRQTFAELGIDSIGAGVIPHHVGKKMKFFYQRVDLDGIPSSSQWRHAVCPRI